MPLHLHRCNLKCPRVRHLALGGCRILRPHPQHFRIFWPPPLMAQSQISRFCSFCLRFWNPSPPHQLRSCGRHIWKPPYMSTKLFLILDIRAGISQIVLHVPSFVSGNQSIKCITKLMMRWDSARSSLLANHGTFKGCVTTQLHLPMPSPVFPKVESK